MRNDSFHPLYSCLSTNIHLCLHTIVPQYFCKWTACSNNLRTWSRHMHAFCPTCSCSPSFSSFTLHSSAKTKSPSSNLFSLLYPQTQKNEIEVSLKYGIALLFQSVLWVVAMLFSSVTTSVPTLANVTTSTWRTVHTSFGNITNHLSAYSYVA
jgi:hypothetical protein